MDEQLAQIYGTGQSESYDHEDLQKTAAAELLVKLAAEQGVDLNSFSDSDIGEMISELYKSAEGTEVAEKKEEKKEGEEEEEEKKNAQEKVAEADFLGRVMAHAMVQELNGIDKVAAETQTPDRSAFTGLSKLRQRGRESKAFQAATHGLAGGALGALAGGGSGKAALLGGLAGAGLGAGAGALRASLAKGKRQALAELSHDEKRASALDALAEQRAWEMAKEAGYVDDQGNLCAPVEKQKQASTLDTAVDYRALQLLEAAGLPIEWNS